ncbi:MAG: ACT domain-containing protein [Thaumarchaeota archaeon]|nr:ACT domain-containing protein [Nitrososphaerota archaeon]
MHSGRLRVANKRTPSQGNRVSVSEAVSKIILGNYVVHESLKLRIVNYHGLAGKISSEVEGLTGKKAKMDTIVVAIKRFSDGLGEGKIEEMSASLKDSKLDLEGGVVDVTIAGKDTKAQQILEDVLRLQPKFSGTPNVIQLPSSVKIIAEEKDAKLLEEALWGRYETSLKRNVAKITIRLSPSREKVPGIAAFITELLYRNGVSILDAFLSDEDVMLIVQEKFSPKAYQVLSEEISG